MAIQLSEHFDYRKLCRFTMPTIVMMIFTSVYSVVDGIFVSNFVGKTPFAAVNLIMPFLMIIGTFGFMVGTGGSAVVSKTMGEGNPERANRYFSLMIAFAIVGGLILTALGEIFLVNVVRLMGAKEGDMLRDCVLYGRIMLLGTMPYILQNVFQSFLVTAERPKLGLLLTVGAGLTNMALDFVFIAVFHWGLAGAALATIVSQIIGGGVPFVYFLRGNRSPLRLTRTRFEGRVLLKACTNGSSEMLSNVSMSLVSMLYNLQLMRIAGEDGVAAYGVIMYVNFVFTAVFFGYSIGSAPVIGFHYGAQNCGELKSLFTKSLTIIGISGMALTALAVLLAAPLAGVFVGYDEALLAMTSHGFRLYAVAFPVMGFNIFGSSFFTALNDGAASAVISFLRTFVFQIAAMLVLPNLLGLNGIWLAIGAAEAAAMAVTAGLLAKKRKLYGYA
ncbi:MAG: MATE family efflux transporter [Clostridia bacterium]|nr:MATE family efflux transporter [Clostridia bacterium]